MQAKSSFGQELTYDCQLGCHVSSKRSRRNFSRKCHKGGMFDCDYEQNRSHPHQSSFQSRLSGFLVTKPREVMDRLSSDVQIVQHFEPLEFHCFDGFSSDGTANPVLLTGSGICDAVGIFIIMQLQSAHICVNRHMDYSPEGCGKNLLIRHSISQLQDEFDLTFNVAVLHCNARTSKDVLQKLRLIWNL